MICKLKLHQTAYVVPSHHFIKVRFAEKLIRSVLARALADMFENPCVLDIATGEHDV